MEKLTKSSHKYLSSVVIHSVTSRCCSDVMEPAEDVVIDAAVLAGGCMCCTNNELWLYHVNQY